MVTIVNNMVLHPCKLLKIDFKHSHHAHTQRFSPHTHTHKELTIWGDVCANYHIKLYALKMYNYIWQLFLNEVRKKITTSKKLNKTKAMM